MRQVIGLRYRWTVCVCMALLWVAAPVSPARAAPRNHALRTVFLVVMENHDWSSIAGNSDAPYINHTLLKIGAIATHYYNPPSLHPSLPNYLWLEAGSNFGVTDDGPPSANGQSTTRHLTTLLTRAHVSWRAYAQGISGVDCPVSDAYPYAVKHNAMVYFRDVSAHKSYCIAHERPASQLAGDLRRGRVARYNVITPDLCHDMHDSCAPLNNQVRQGDSWLAATIPLILHSSAYRKGGVILITWDEGEGDDGPIGMIAVSRQARAGSRTAIHFTHSSALRTIQEIFGVRPMLGDAAHARDLRSMFRAFP